MASEIRVNSINNRSGLGTVTIADSGIVVSGLVTATTFSGNVTGNVTGNVSGNITIGAGSTSAPSLAPSGDSNTGIFFPAADTIAFAEGGTEVGRFDSSGRLLVGTTNIGGASYNSYYSNLIIAGNTFDNTFGRLSIKTKTASASLSSGSVIGDIFFSENGGGDFAGIVVEADATAGTNDFPGRIIFKTTADGASSPTERMRISAKGDILTGSTSTWGAADSGASFYIHNNSDQQTLKISNGDPGSSPYGLVGFYRNKGSVIARITTDGSTVSYNTSSDYRLKENITLLTGATDRLKQIPVHRFNFIADPGKTVDGFIAHEVQEIVPEAINGEKDGIDSDGNPVYQGIDQSKLVPLLTAALQEALEEIETLKAQNATLKNDFTALAARVTALESA